MEGIRRRDKKAVEKGVIDKNDVRRHHYRDDKNEEVKKPHQRPSHEEGHCENPKKKE